MFLSRLHIWRSIFFESNAKLPRESHTWEHTAQAQGNQDQGKADERNKMKMARIQSWAFEILEIPRSLTFCQKLMHGILWQSNRLNLEKILHRIWKNDDWYARLVRMRKNRLEIRRRLKSGRTERGQKIQVYYYSCISPLKILPRLS